jgi:hypothetical protein
MNSAGVSLIDVARPMPTPAQAPLRRNWTIGEPPTRATSARARQRNATRSAKIMPNSSRFTWPYPSVSRTGSMARNSGTPRAAANQRDQP